jgi:DEAD/DEAH box helicase domain-containing protein
VAVFCDGFQYHACPDKELSRIGDDIAKRRAILESERYRVWAVTWEDVEDFAGGATERIASVLVAPPGQAGANLVRHWKLDPDQSRAGKNSMELLWSWLRFPDAIEWQKHVAGIGAAWVARPEALEPPTIEEYEGALWAELEPVGAEPRKVRIAREFQVLGQLEWRFALRLLGWIGMTSLREQEPRSLNWILRLYDDKASRGQSAFKESWRVFWQAFNLLQFAKGFHFTSTEDLQTRQEEGGKVYPLLVPREGQLA